MLARHVKGIPSLKLDFERVWEGRLHRIANRLALLDVARDEQAARQDLALAMWLVASHGRDLLGCNLEGAAATAALPKPLPPPL